MKKAKSKKILAYVLSFAILVSILSSMQLSVFAEPTLDIDGTALSRQFTFDTFPEIPDPNVVYDAKGTGGDPNYKGNLTNYYIASSASATLGTAAAPILDTGKFGNAMYFRGTSNGFGGDILKPYNNYSYSSKLFSPETGSFSVSLWFKRDISQLGRYQVLAGCGGLTTTGMGWSIQLTPNNRLNVQIGVGGATEAGNSAFMHYTTPITDENWHNVVMVLSVVDSTKVLTGYFDGSTNGMSVGYYYDATLSRQYSVITNTATINPIASAQPFVIGGSSSHTQCKNRYTGYLDDVRIYKGTALNATQVTSLQTASVPLTGITLDKTSGNLFKDATDTLTVSYDPTNTTDNKTVTWSTSDASVATVSNGVVTAVGAGEATITATVGSHTATCVYTVVNPINLSSFTLNGNYISKVGTNVSVGEMTTTLAAQQGVSLTFSNTTNDVVGTGTTINVSGTGLNKTYTVVIYGDITGDGVIGIDDLALIKNHLLKSSVLNNSAKLKAADVNETNSITISDLIAIKKHILNIASIVQH